jgi:hypothetical protein
MSGLSTLTQAQIDAIAAVLVADTTPPTVTGFSIPATSSSLTVSITSLTATDDVGVTGYMVTESAAAPSASAVGWSATVPASYTCATAGAKTLYAWAKDAAGNVSASRSASVTITLADTTPPTVTAFSIPATSSSLTVSLTTFTATDNVGVTGYIVTESSAVPSASAGGWSATPPASYTCATAGAKTLYAWAKDASGNVSSGVSATTTISSSSNGPNLTVWVGKWFKITEKNTGYHYAKPTLSRANSSYTGYLKIWNWDPVNKVLQADRYEQDVQTGQWSSYPLTLHFFAGTQHDFLCWSQETAENYTTGFTARIQGQGKNAELQRATFKSMGGYFVELVNPSGNPSLGNSGSSEQDVGGLSISGSLIPEARVPVPSNTLQH